MLCIQVGNDAAALRILALELQDIVAAEQYCADHPSPDPAAQSSYMQLLDLLLHPGDGTQPMYTQACHLLGSQGTAAGHCTLIILMDVWCVHAAIRPASKIAVYRPGVFKRRFVHCCVS